MNDQSGENVTGSRDGTRCEVERIGTRRDRESGGGAAAAAASERRRAVPQVLTCGGDVGGTG